jgi:hypothetical protein
MTTLEAREAARQRRRDRDWRTVLDGVHVGNRALAAHMIGAMRQPVDHRALAHQWLRGSGYDVYPAQPPFSWEGRCGDRKLLVAAVHDDGLAAVAMYLALRVSERVATQLRAGAGIVLLGWNSRCGYVRRSLERWITADDCCRLEVAGGA